MKRVILFSLIAVAVGAAQTPQELFQQGLVRERSEGKLEEAMQLYRHAAGAAGKDRALAAKALMRLAAGYEKLGNTESRKIYERVLRDYADQKEAATSARARLEYAKGPESPGAEPVSRRVHRASLTYSGSVSPDGRFWTYVKGGDGFSRLTIREIVSGTEREVVERGGTVEYIASSSFSPDSKSVAYRVQHFSPGGGARQVLKLDNIDGTANRILVDNPEIPSISPDDWTPDGRHIVAVLRRMDRSYQIALVSVADGSVRVLKSFPWPTGLVYRARLSPDGKFVAYSRRQSNEPDNTNGGNFDIFLLAMDGSYEGALVVNPSQDFSVGWAPDGRFLFVSNRTGSDALWAVPLGNGKPLGAPAMVQHLPGGDLLDSQIRRGTVYLNTHHNESNALVATMDVQTGKLLGTPVSLTESLPAQADYPAFSPDGNYAAVLTRVSPQRTAILIRTLATGQERIIQIGGLARPQQLHWSPDANWLVLRGNAPSGPGIYRVDLNGNLSSLASAGQRNIFGHTLSPDGRRVYFLESNADNTGRTLWSKDLPTGKEKEVYDVPGGGRMWGMLSPSGRSMLFVDPAKTLFVMDLDSERVRRLPPSLVEIKSGIAWGPDDRYVVAFCGAHDERRSRTLCRISTEDGQVRELGSIEPGLGNYPTSVHPGGNQIAFNEWHDVSEFWIMKNLFPAAKASR
jgi:Tol biopolymer transport system component